jgi:zinc protease
VKAQVVAGDVFRRDSVFYQAMQLGQLAVSGLDLDLIDERVRRIGAVTPEQVSAVARKYLVDSNLTVAVLDPLPISSNAKPPAAQRESNAH